MLNFTSTKQLHQNFGRKNLIFSRIFDIIYIESEREIWAGSSDGREPVRLGAGGGGGSNPPRPNYLLRRHTVIIVAGRTAPSIRNRAALAVVSGVHLTKKIRLTAVRAVGL